MGRQFHHVGAQGLGQGVDVVGGGFSVGSDFHLASRDLRLAVIDAAIDKELKRRERGAK